MIEETISVIAKYDGGAEKILARVRGDQGNALARRQSQQHDAIRTRHNNTIEERHGDLYGQPRSHGHSHGSHTH